MSTHGGTYDADGLSTCDPWTLGDYLHEDGFTPREQTVIVESVLSWLREYENAGVDLTEALKEIAGA